MITSTYAWRTRRILRWTLIVSLLVHLLIGIFWFAVQPLIKTTLARVSPHARPTPDEIVTISNATRIERKPRVRVSRGTPAHALPPRPRVVAVAPHPHAVAAQATVPKPQPKPAVTPVPKPPSKAEHELAKLVPKAPAQPRKTVRQKTVTDVPTAEPATPVPQTAQATPPPERRARTAVEKQIAALQPKDLTRPAQPAQPSQATQPHQFSQEQIARINNDLAKSIAQDRAENNPLNVRAYQNPATPVHHSFQMFGVDPAMRGSQGLCDPIKSWSTEDGWDYYYVTCHAVFTDGFTDDEPVPWPVRFRPNDDPYLGHGGQNRPLALPLPGWTLPPGVQVGEGVRGYAREHGVNL